MGIETLVAVRSRVLDSDAMFRIAENAADPAGHILRISLLDQGSLYAWLNEHFGDYANTRMTIAARDKVHVSMAYRAHEASLADTAGPPRGSATSLFPEGLPAGRIIRSPVPPCHYLFVLRDGGDRQRHLDWIARAGAEIVLVHGGEAEVLFDLESTWRTVGAPLRLEEIGARR